MKYNPLLFPKRASQVAVRYIYIYIYIERERERERYDQRRQWHPTLVLLPGKSMDRGTW